MVNSHLPGTCNYSPGGIGLNLRNSYLDLVLGQGKSSCMQLSVRTSARVGTKELLIESVRIIYRKDPTCSGLEYTPCRSIKCILEGDRSFCLLHQYVTKQLRIIQII
ncbi:hypothetical protein BDE02_06G187800 [Populus trichocarpa]|nr:hypothetical protein BDE02_06G187800 [Populus trichocarpa]